MIRGVNQNDDMMAQHNKVAATLIYHPLLMIYILIVTLLASTKLRIIALLLLGSALVLAGL